MKSEIKACIKYFVRVINHKIKVAKGCFNQGLYFQGIVHDLSKSLPDEYIPYAYKFKWPVEKTDKEKELIERNFRVARDKHFSRNLHHWKYWVIDEYQNLAFEMPGKYIKEMICDWESVGEVKGDSAKEFYERDKNKMVLHPNTRKVLEEILSKK